MHSACTCIMFVHYAHSCVTVLCTLSRTNSNKCIRVHIQYVLAPRALFTRFVLCALSKQEISKGAPEHRGYIYSLCALCALCILYTFPQCVVHFGAQGIIFNYNNVHCSTAQRLCPCADPRAILCRTVLWTARAHYPRGTSRV